MVFLKPIVSNMDKDGFLITKWSFDEKNFGTNIFFDGSRMEKSW